MGETGAKKSAGKATQGVWGLIRDDSKILLDELENLLLVEVRNYFMVRWSRHYRKFDEHKLMNRLQYMIVQAIKDGRLPKKLNLCHYVPPRYILNNYPIPVIYMEAHLIAVGTYLQEKMIAPDQYRAEEYRARLEKRLSQFEGKPMITSLPIPDDTRVPRTKKVRKIKRSVRTGRVVA